MFLFRNYNFISAYLDNILIVSQTLNDHIEHLKYFFEIASLNSLSINFDKSEFLVKETKFFGLKLGVTGIQPDSTRVNMLREIRLKNKRNIQRICDILQWFRPFIVNLSNQTKFLSDYLKKNKRVQWKEEDQLKLNAIIEQVKQETMLVYLDFTSIFYIETDAS